MYIEELLYKLFFIALILWEEVIIGLTKKLVVLYVVRDLVFLDQVYKDINTKIGVLLWLISHIL